jgi:capsular polysaccharide biosynthesis protein
MRALIGVWWLVLGGLIVGVVVGGAAYKLQSKARHTATAELLVNSPSQPYLRTAEPQVTTHSSTSRSSATSAATPPDTQTVVTAANLYPFLIQSDQIARYRESLYGQTPGTLTATAHNSSTNSFGVYHPSPLPIIDVTAKARFGSDASTLVNNTVQAFSKWMTAQQRAKGITPSQRITVTELNTPVVKATGGPKPGLPIFVGFLVFLAFCALALVVGRARGGSVATAPAPVGHAPGTSASPNLRS